MGIRQAEPDTHLSFFAKLVYKLSGGKRPKTLFCQKANAEHIGTRVRVVSSDKYSTTIAKFDADGNMSDEDFVILTGTDLHLDHGMENNEKPSSALCATSRISSPI